MRSFALLTTLVCLFLVANSAVENKVDTMIKEPTFEGVSSLLDKALTPFESDVVNLLVTEELEEPSDLYVCIPTGGLRECVQGSECCDNCCV